MKRIDAIVKYFYPVAAGIETNMLETYSVLATKGWDVVVHTSKDSLTKKNVFAEKQTIRKLSIKRYLYHWYSFIPQINWDETSVVGLHNFNIIPHGFILAYALLRKLQGKRNPLIILTPHGGFTPDWEIFSWLGAFIKKIYHFTIGTFLINQTVDGVRAVSEWEKEQIVTAGVSKNLVTVISNGIENEAYENLEKTASKEIKEKVRTYGKYLITIARIYDIKNYETTLRALALLPQDINYVIVGPVGSNDYLEKLKNLIAQLGLTKRVFFAGVIRGVDKYYLIKHAQMMVHMARWESFCNAVHEGMSQGLVCIVADNTALSRLVKNNVNGYLIPTMDHKTLATKINFVLSNQNSKEVKTIKEINRTTALSHSWKSVAGKIDTWFQTLLK